MLAAVVPHLVHAHAVAVGHDVPVAEVAVDAGDGVSWKLKHLEARLAHLYVALAAGGEGRQQRKATNE